MSAIAATWLAFCLALALALPQPPDPRHLALGAFGGAVIIALGFFFVSRTRPIAARSFAERTKFAAWSLLLSAVLGAILLSVLVAAAAAEPGLHARFAGRLHEPSWRPWALAFESSILEEVLFRLLVMSAVAWIVARIVRQPKAAFLSALSLSAFAFGLAHVPAWSSVAHPTPLLIAAVLLLNGTGGALFGWVFWRWGLPYAILCHFAGDVVIQSVAPRLLG